MVHSLQKEIDNIENIGVLNVVNKPQTKEVIPLHEIFVTKYDNILKRWKAKCRFVARGDLQTTLGDFYSPVASCVTLRMFLTICTTFDGSIRQLDVTGAFLYGRLESPVYIQLPKGHQEYSKTVPVKVWECYSSLYGLVEAPQIWNQTIDKTLTEMGLQALVSEPCLYLKRNAEQDLLMILVLYVDDVLYCGTFDELESFEASISEEISDQIT